MTVKERESLYNEVWSEPVVTVAKKYGISDNGLRKRCLAAGIPLPPKGYWAKKQAGQAVHQTDLPPLTSELKKYISGYAIMFSKDIKTLSDEELKSREPLYIYSDFSKELIQSTCKSIQVETQLRNPHALIQEHKSEMQYREKQKHENPTYRMSRYWFQNISSKPVLNIEVSKEQISRAYRIMDTLIKTIEPLEAKVSSEKNIDRDSCLIQIPNQIFEVSITEETKQVRVKGHPSNVVYTGQLCLKLSSRFYHDDEMTFSDKEQVPLEEQLGNIIYFIFDDTSKQLLKGEITHRNWVREREEEKLRLQREQRQNEELLKLKEIEEEAKCYQRAQVLRRYANALKDSISDTSLGSSKMQKINWILDKADWLDPLIQKDDNVLGRKHYVAHND